MTPNKPRDFGNPTCCHINHHSVLNGPWSDCDDCDALHVRAVVSLTPTGVQLAAGARRIHRALAESSEVLVGASGLPGQLKLLRDGYGAIPATLAGQPVTLTEI